jgi:hypothetical protein
VPGLTSGGGLSAAARRSLAPEPKTGGDSYGSVAIPLAEAFENKHVPCLPDRGLWPLSH